MAEAGGVPRVSVILPVFNRAHTVAAAIDSVRAQTVGDWELVVVDDGSTDGSAAVAEACGDPRVRVLRLGRNRGAAGARNAGVGVSRGELIAFLDSDDTWTPDKLKIQTAALDRAPDLGGLTMGFDLIRQASGRRERRRPQDGAATLPYLLDGCHVSPGSTLMVRRAFWETVGPFEPNLKRFEDWDWLLRAAAHGPIGTLPDIGAVVYVGPQPDRARTAEAIETLRPRHIKRIMELSDMGGLARFEASLAAEELVAALRDGDRRAAVGLGLTMLIHSPPRLFRLAKRAARRLIP